MARTVKDAAIFLGALAGVDPQDSFTLASKGKAEADYTKFLDANGLKGKRLGVEKIGNGRQPWHGGFTERCYQNAGK
jgi:amidase